MPLPHNSPFKTRHGSMIYYLGPSLEEGPKPTVIYFALSGHASLYIDPFNQSPVHLSQMGIRVLSWDLPFHEPGQDPHQAMHQWAAEFTRNPAFISDFIDRCMDMIEELMQLELIDTKRLAVAGLSRGGFIATHLAARNPNIKYVLGFAPLTEPQPPLELATFSFEKIALRSLVDKLIHLHLRFYMGNRDTRVGTDACYNFIRTLTEKAFDNGVRSPNIELILYPSVGHKGHGTPPYIFQEGAEWISRQLLE